MSIKEYKDIDIELIEFDLENPRIIKELSAIAEKDRSNHAPALLILSHSDEPGPAREELEKSIIANDGISRAIELIALEDSTSEKKYKVVDGNTRLAVYKKLKKKDPENQSWHKISSCIYSDVNKDKLKEKLDDIRLLAHFMPVKQWSLYAKGQYINKLCITKDFDEIALKLGGRTSIIRELHKAYIFFTEHYEEVCKEGDNIAGADESKFSHFVEAGKGSVEIALESHFDSLDDGKRQFANWVSKGKFRRAIDVRDLPAVLDDDNAREAFIKGTVKDIAQAKDLLPKFGIVDIKLNEADIENLCVALASKLASIDRRTMDLIKDGTMSSTSDSLMLLAIDLEKIIEEIEEN